MKLFVKSSSLKHKKCTSKPVYSAFQRPLHKFSA